jgi:hypothetical protein
MALVEISDSVGRGGRNNLIDVGKIGAALVAVGPDRGGIFAPPLTVEGLAQAIKSFQDFHSLPVRDGKVDKQGNTIRKINAILNGGIAPIPPPQPPGGTDELLPLDTSGLELGDSVNKSFWTPQEAAIDRDYLFQWTGFAGSGKLFYFKLDANVVPKYFGVLVPTGVTDVGSGRVHIFFHPTPKQAGHDDSQYQTLGTFYKIFHYLNEEMGAAFCASGTSRVMVMPLMTQGSAGDCGIFPIRWRELIGRMLGMIRSGNMSGSGQVDVNDVVVSSFSAGIAYSHAFRARAGLGSKLTGVIDFDGLYSSYRALCSSITGPKGHIAKMYQMASSPGSISSLASQGIFPVNRERWLSPPWDSYMPKDPVRAGGTIHSLTPQTMMFFAARRLR